MIIFQGPFYTHNTVSLKATSQGINIITGRTRNADNSNLRPNRVRTSSFRDSFLIASFPYGSISHWIFMKLKLYLPSKTIYLTTSLPNLLLPVILTPLEFKHGKHLNNKLAKNVGIIYSLRHYLGFHMLKQLYYTLIKFYPYLNYGLASWGAAYKTRLRKMCTTQNRFI